jgi:hypothetical protein
VTATVPGVLRDAVRDAARPSSAVPPVSSVAYSTPRIRESRCVRASTAEASAPKAATGCPRRGSATARSTAIPAASPAATAHGGAGRARAERGTRRA